jgi:N-acetyl-anhydromuramyl-L-alanine amidase AmpD
MQGYHCLAEIPEGERVRFTAPEKLKHAANRVAEAMRSATSDKFFIRTNIRTANYGPWAMSPPVGILLHHTAGDEDSDIPTLTRAGTGVSSNYYVTRQGAIYEFAPYPRRAWHAGDSEWAGVRDWNTHALGIELENYGNGQDWPAVQIDALVWLCRRLVKQFPGIRSNHALLARHRDVALPRGRKTDPASNFPYTTVRNRIFAATDPTDPGGVTPVPDAKGYYVRLKTSLPAGKAIHELATEEAAKKEQARLKNNHGIETTLDPKA